MTELYVIVAERPVRLRILELRPGIAEVSYQLYNENLIKMIEKKFGIMSSEVQPDGTVIHKLKR